MHLAIDCSILDGRMTGIERYVTEVGQALVRMQIASGWKVDVLVAKGQRARFAAIDERQRVIESPFRSKFVTQQIWIPWIVRRLRADVAFFPGFPPSPLVFAAAGKTQVVRTIFDAAMWSMPETTSIKNKLYYRPLEQWGARRYNLVHTISDHARDEIERFLPWLKGRIKASGCGVSARVVDRHASRSTTVLQQGLQQYLLFVGTLEPRKNLVFLLRAFKGVVSARPHIKLVLAGRPGWGSAEVLSTIEELQLTSHVVLTGAITDEELTALYLGAIALVYPSLYEGFGLPVVEAMTLGLPVVSSNSSSLPEVCGDAGILLDPADQVAWQESMLRIVDSPELRQQMAGAGKVQARRFEWESVARRIAETFDDIAPVRS